MKKAFALILSVMFVFALTTVTFAAEKKDAPVKADRKMMKSDRMRISGEVTAVDTKANTVTVKGKKNEVTLSLDEKTVIRSGKEKKTLADIKTGDKIHVLYAEADGKNVAKRIAMKSPKMEKKMERRMERQKMRMHKMKAMEQKGAASEAPEKEKSAGY